MGPFVPEAALWCAYTQWHDARAVLVAVNEASVVQAGQTQTAAPVSGSEPARLMAWWNSPPLVDGFDMEGAFFVVMGGFTIGLPGLPHKQLTVTPRGLIQLLGAGVVLPRHLDQCKTDITDKAKADMLAKFLVCSQGLWLIIQCIARHVQGLPVTLLEIHIMVHVVCAVVINSLTTASPCLSRSRNTSLLCFAIIPNTEQVTFMSHAPYLARCGQDCRYQPAATIQKWRSYPGLFGIGPARPRSFSSTWEASIKVPIVSPGSVTKFLSIGKKVFMSHATPV